MKITDIEIIVYAEPLITPKYDNSNVGEVWASSGDREFTLCKISTDEGVFGTCATWITGGDPTVVGKAVINYMKPVIIGMDPLDIEGIWQTMWKHDRLFFTPLFTMGLIDTALWDLKGKILGLPVYKLLGAVREKMPCYASSPVYPVIEDYVEEVQRCVDMGYTAYKLHGLGDVQRDIDLCTAVRKAVGDDIALMLDCVATYDYVEALRVGRALDELKFFWYEEPLRDYDLHNYRTLRQKIDTPITHSEVIPGHLFVVPESIETYAVDMIRADVNFKAGVTGCMKLAHLAEAFGLRCEFHGTGSAGWQCEANLQCQLAIKNTTYHEVLVPQEWFRSKALQEMIVDKQGNMAAFQGPGFGREIDWKWIDSHTRYTIK